MKYRIYALLFIFSASSLVVSGTELFAKTISADSILVAQSSSSKRRRAKTSTRSKSRSRKSRRSNSPLIKALRLAKAKNYTEASKLLFRLSHNKRYRRQRMQIKYILGLMLYEMNLNQVSAFQFVSVVKQGKNKYLRQALEKMSLAADSLGDDTLLNYALSKVKVNEFPKVHRDMLYFRIGEFQLTNQQYSNAIASLNKVNVASSYYPQAKYLQGLAYAEQGQNARAIRRFEQLANVRADRGITDPSRVAALIGKARVLYQDKKWQKAIDAYREIPRDTEFWHDSIFEMSWAMLRTGRFRSALSNFHSLHSAYYEHTFQPESLLLRSIIYLYICKYDEMEKVLQLFSEIYAPVLRDIKSVQAANVSSEALFEQVNVVGEFVEGEVEIDQWKNDVPFIISKRIYYEGDFQRMRNYIGKLHREMKKLDSMPASWKSSSIGKYSERVLQTRLRKAKNKAGRLAKAHINDIRAELFDLFEQKDFIRFEMLKGKKDSLQKDLAGKDLSDVQIDEQNKRDFYIQNGYQYWPFRGEYWLDELGNYHYLGVQSCE